MRSFICVHLPCDASQPCVERTVVIPPGPHAEVSCLMDDLKTHFSAQGGFRDESHREEYLRSIQSQLPAATPGASTASAAAARATATSRLMSMQLIDCVILLPNCERGKWELVCLYVDDKGAAKGMPTNARATQICCGVGLPQYTSGGNRIAGDAFIARSVDDNSDLYGRRDFKLGEMDSSSDWFKMASLLNSEAAARREQTGFNAGNGKGAGGAGASALKALTGGAAQAQQQKPDPFADTPPAKRWEHATDAKAKGNAAFKAKNYKGAAAAYRLATTLLDRCPTRVGEETAAGAQDADAPPLMTAVLELSLAVNLNCAAAELKLGELTAAQRSASISLIVCDRIDEMGGLGGADPAAERAQAVKQRVKALFRRGAARIRAGHVKSARDDLLKAARLAPQDRAVRTLYAEAKAAMAEKVAESKLRRKQAWGGGQGLFAKGSGAEVPHAAAAAVSAAPPAGAQVGDGEFLRNRTEAQIEELGDGEDDDGADEPMTEDGSMATGALRPDLDGFGMHVRPMTSDAVKAMVDNAEGGAGAGREGMEADITPG